MTTTIRKHLGHVPAMHQLPNHEGLCRNPHGHNYAVEVECEGVPYPAKGASNDGMIVDFTDITNAWKHIKPVWDHMDLNVVLTAPDSGGMVGDPAAAVTLRRARRYPVLVGPTTAENLAAWLLEAFVIEFVPATAVTLWETPTSCARVTE